MEKKKKKKLWDCIKPESFCTAKETINKMKKQPIEWERIFANLMSDKGLTSKIKNSYNSSKNIDNLIKMGRRSELIFFQRHTDSQ